MRSRNITQYKKKDPVTGAWIIPVKRDCLKCGKKFLSYSEYRRCDNCLRSDSNKQNVMEYNIEVY